MIVTVLERAIALVRWLVKLEIGIWRSLFLLAARRVPGQGPGVQAFAYAREVTPIMGAFIFVSALELPVVHLLLPWETIRLIADLLSIWGLLWMIGFLAGMKVFPHLLDDDGLRVRQGPTIDIHIPLEAIASVTSRRGSVPTNRSVHVEHSDEGAFVDVAVLKQTKVVVVLEQPTTIELPSGREEVTELRFYVDDPRRFVAAARERLADRLAGPLPLRQARSRRDPGC